MPNTICLIAVAPKSGHALGTSHVSSSDLLRQAAVITANVAHDGVVLGE